MNEDKAFDLLRKLHALAVRGVDGEKLNAEKAMQRLMRKYGFKPEDLESERQVRRQFDFTTKQHKTFVLQCIASVIGSHGRSYTTLKGKRGLLFVDLTTSEHLEIIIRLDHYWKAWQRESLAFYDAFIQANKLYAKRQDRPATEPPKMTAEELERMRRMLGLMDAARVEPPVKKLERSEKLTA